MRSAVAYLSTDNLLHNLKVIKQLVSGSKIMAMVKANAYGHGLRSTALRLQNHLDFIGVASIDEALQLRKSGIFIPIILIEGIFEQEELAIASYEKFPIVFHDKHQLEWLYKESSAISKPIYAWIKIDTGMSRLGFNLKEALDVYEMLNANHNIMQPIGIMSHFACADDLSHQLNTQQINNFDNFFKNPTIIQSEILKSFCNSAAVFNFPNQHYDLVRPGIALYGVSPIINKSAQELNLKPVMTLKTKIIAIKNLLKNSYVGYGGRFVCPKDIKAGVIAIGYGDGYPRTAIDGTPVLIDGTRCQIIGKVSMDMAVVDLSNCVDAKVGDAVVLWGDGLPIEEVANFTANSPYDLLTAIQNRVKFCWN